MKKLYYIFLSIVILAPFLFYIYLKNDLVCAPRAITASAIFGLVPLIFLTAAIIKKTSFFYYLSSAILVIEIIITPVIMLKRLGWDKFVNERLLAFFTFEAISIIQLFIVIILLMELLKEKKN
jgi:uncharacterized membrane protein